MVASRTERTWRDSNPRATVTLPPQAATPVNSQSAAAPVNSSVRRAIDNGNDTVVARHRQKPPAGERLRSWQPDYWASNLVKPLATRDRTSAPPAIVCGPASGSLTAQA